jgi:hypothetical protein
MAGYNATFTPEQLQSEIWKPYLNWNFSVSSIGRVRNDRTGVIRKLSLTQKGYLVVTLWFQQKAYTVIVHRLVAELFIGAAPEGQNQVNHKDGDKTNNLTENLEWVDQQQNMNHAKSLGLIASGERSGRCRHPERFPRIYGDRNGMRTHPESVPRGESNGNSKLSDEKVKAIRREYASRKVSQRKLAIKYDVSQKLIMLIVNNQIWRHVQ